MLVLADVEVADCLILLFVSGHQTNENEDSYTMHIKVLQLVIYLWLTLVEIKSIKVITLINC